MEKKLTNWELDPAQSEVGVKVKSRLFVTFTGIFSDYKFTLLTEDGTFEKPIISFEAKLDSVSTGNEERDEQIRKSPVLQTESNPTVAFQSNEVKKESEHRYLVYGDLRIFDITKPLVMEMEYNGIRRTPGDVISTHFILSGKVQYQDYLVNWDKLKSTARLILSDEVAVFAKVFLQKM